MANPKDDPEYDEYCDPDNPRKINYTDILAASRRIVGLIVKTPCVKCHMSAKLGMDLYFKQEFLQYTGCFKERGVVNTLLLFNDEQKKYGAISASAGNHGAALSYHGTHMGIPAIIVVPVTAPVSKINRVQAYGGKIILHGPTLTESKKFAMTLAKEKKMQYVNGFDHPNVIEGQGSTGIEILEQLPTVDAVLVPCGGGSLLAGVAIAIKHLKPDTEIYGVETDKTCSMTESLRKNERIFMPMESTIADGLAVGKVGVNTFHSLKGLVDKMVVVKEDWVARTITHVVEEEKMILEGGGAVACAAILAGLFPNLKGKKVVCICSGGNIDTTTLSRALERGMALEGRLVNFKVTVPDRPGGLADLCALLASIRVTMRDCFPERAWVKGNVYKVELKMIVETRGWDHTKELVELIKKTYPEHFIPEMSGLGNMNGAGTKRGPCLAPNPVCLNRIN